MQCCNSKFWWSAAVVTVALVILGVATCIVVLYTSFTYEESLHLTSGDTRLISSYSFTFCESLRLENTGMPNNLETSLFIFPDLETDELSKSNVFSTSIADLSLTNYRYHYWKVFIHPGSTMTLEACVLSGTGMEFLIISNGDFNEWRDSLNPTTQTIGIRITNRCSEGMKEKTIDYDIEDVYYILFIGLKSSDVNVLNGTLFFAIPEYDTEVKSKDHCATGGRHVLPCTVSVPFYSGFYSVISAEATSLGLHSGIAAVDVKVSCEPRALVYTLMAVVPVVITVIVCFISGCVVLYVKKLLDHPQRPDGGQDPAADIISNADLVHHP